MKSTTGTSVSTSCSVAKAARTLSPLRSGWHLEVRDRAESAIEHRPVLVRRDLAEIRVDRVAHDGRERLSLATTTRVECLSLCLGQVDLRSCRSHIPHNIQHDLEDDSPVVR